MDTTRQNKVSRLLQKELGQVFQRESRTLFGNVFITVTMVRISPDLSVAKVYLSLFGMKNKQKTMTLIEEKTKIIRAKLAEKIGKQVRIIPNLDFFLDDSLDYALNIENLLKNPSPEIIEIKKGKRK